MVKKTARGKIFAEDEIRGEVLQLIRDAVAGGSPFTFRALGSSMFPLIPGGAEVTVEKFDAVPPPVGTVCVAIRKERLYCHRLVKVMPEAGGRRAYVLKGDNHRLPDEPFAEEDLVGKVTRLRLGPIDVSSDFLPLRLAGRLWMAFPGPAILAASVGWKLALPARAALRALLGPSSRSPHGDEDDGDELPPAWKSGDL
jgi:hypothetical protein